jgi:hypothetical protein
VGRALHSGSLRRRRGMVGDPRPGSIIISNRFAGVETCAHLAERGWMNCEIGSRIIAKAHSEISDRCGIVA